MKAYLDIPYTSDPSYGTYGEFDLYVPNGALPSAPLLCFVHGGAWRSEDKSQHAQLAQRLAELTTFPVAVPNYRLTQPPTLLKHPAHTEDLLQFLHFILAWNGPNNEARPFNPSRLHVFGHSCSAHMLTCTLLSPPSNTTTSDASSGTLTPSPALLQAVKGIVLSEGIYDIDLLLRSFPTYKEWFIINTFRDLPSYEELNTASYELRHGGEHTQWLIIHSQGDTLVDTAQSHTMLARLQEQISRSGQGSVEANWELASDHNDILREGYYPEIVGQFVLRCEGIAPSQ